LTIITTECDATDRQTIPNMLTEFVNPCFAHMLSKVRKQFRKKPCEIRYIWILFNISIAVYSLYIVYVYKY